MKCPECRFEILSLPCPFCKEREDWCKEQKDEWDRRWRAAKEEFSLISGPPTNESDRASLKLALEAMRRRFEKDRFQGELRFDHAKLLRCDNWWYIPFSWIGCFGFIVDRRDGGVDWLSSGFMTLSDCFWGHNRGIICGPIDFTFTPEVSASEDTILSLVKMFRRCVRRAQSEDLDYVGYSIEDAMEAIKTRFPTFKFHCAWGAIPAIREATERELISFHAELTSETA
jgi:hypothetical protein